MIETIMVGLGQRNYPISIGEKAALELVPHLEKNPSNSAVIVTDSSVGGSVKKKDKG